MQGFLCRLRAGCRNGGRIGLSRQPCCRRPHSVCRGVIRRRCRTDVLRSVRAAGGTDRGTALIDPLLRGLLRFFGLGCRRFRAFLCPLRLFRRRDGKPLLRLQQLLHRNSLRPIQRLKIILVQIPNGREIFVACFFGLLQEFRKLLSCYVDILPSVCYTTNIAARWKGTGT